MATTTDLRNTTSIVLADNTTGQISALKVRGVFDLVATVIDDIITSTVPNFQSLMTGNLVFSPGSVIETRSEGYSFLALAITDASAHVIAQNGQRYRVLPKDGVYPAGAFGARPGTGTDQRSALQTAINAVSSAGGGVLQLDSGVYDIGFSGTLSGSRRMGLIIASNVTVRGNGVDVTRLRVLTGADVDLLSNNRFPAGGEILIENFFLQDVTLDGNAANQSASAVEGFNIRLWGFRNCGLRNVKSLDPNTWGVRLEYGNGLLIHDIVCRHGPQSNSDGIHFVDCDNVVGGNFDVYTEGDDGCIIEVTNKATITSYALSGILISTPNGLNISARGLLLLADPNVVGVGARQMRNIHVTGLAVRNCSGAGVILTGGIFDNINISGVVDACGFGLALVPGSAAFQGRIRNCSFDLNISGCRDKGTGGGTGASFFVNDTNGTLSSNHLRLNIFDPAPTISVLTMRGSLWSGEINVTYPGSADRPANGMVLYILNSSLQLSAVGCVVGINMQATAVNNTLRLGSVEGNGGDSIQLLTGATGNQFSGGRINAAITNPAGANAKFWGVSGADNKGASNQNTNGAGEIVVNHGLVQTPVTVMTQIYGQTGVANVRISSRTATTFTMLCLDGAGNPVVSTPASIAWSASL